MICFEKLVKNILTEAGEAPKDDPTKLNDEDSKSLQQYIDVKYSTDIQPIYTHYTASNIYTLPSKEELKQIAIIVANNSLRNVKDSDAFPKIKTVYPLLDLFAQLSFIYKRTSGLDATQRQREAQKILDSFKETVSKSSKTPLDYPAINAWAQSVKQEYFSEEKGQIGKLRLESVDKKLSFYGTIKHLLALRSTAMEKSIPLERIPNPTKFVEDIFLNPTFYRDGKSAVPSDKKIQELYNETTSAQLLSISMAAYQLFKQQATMIVGVDDNDKLRMADEQRAYVEYIGGLSGSNQQIAKEFEWSKYELPKTESFTSFNFNEVVKEALETFGGIITGDLEAAKMTDSDKPTDSEISKEIKPFETAAGSNKFLYSLGNLEKHKQDVPLAGNLYKHLESLANYIVKELEIDWMGAVTKATSALRGLADASPNLGGGGLTG